MISNSLKPKKAGVSFVLILLLFVFARPGFGGEAGRIYSEAKSAARRGKQDFAFIRFDSLLRRFPDSRYAQDALFANGEYYFQIGDYRDAVRIFKKLAQKYPDSKSKPFDLAYRLRIAREEDDQELVQDLEKEIVAFERLSLFFRESKEHQYRSPLNRKHKVIYFIDKVEFYVDGELFEKVSY
ncbi:tol-pal system YbgF family protein [Candidatus Omnitrophota bacterium]